MTVTHEHLNKCKESVTKEFSESLQEHMDSENLRYATLKAQHEELRLELQEISHDVKALMRLFEQSKGALAVIKWIALGIAGVWATIQWFVNHVKF